MEDYTIGSSKMKKEALPKILKADPTRIYYSLLMDQVYLATREETDQYDSIYWEFVGYL